MLMALIARTFGLKQIPTREIGLKPFDLRADADDAALLPEPMFKKMLAFEKSRSKYSGRRFVLMLVDVHHLLNAKDGDAIREAISNAIAVGLRITDMKGWYQEGKVVGVLCTEIGFGNIDFILDTLHKKVTTLLQKHLTAEQMSAVQLSFEVLPGGLGVEENGLPAESEAYFKFHEQPNVSSGPQPIHSAS